MENALYAKIKSNCNMLGIKDSAKIVVAVSGGADSIALMLLMSRYYNIYVVTFNHGVRDESNDEVLFVASLCKKLNITFEILNIKADLLNYSLSFNSDDAIHNSSFNLDSVLDVNLDINKIKNFQNKARNIRYKHLINIAKKQNIQFIATGHHLDDITESFMLKILRAGGSFAFSTNNT